MSSHGVAIVTGAGRRLGKQIAIALAKTGYDLVVSYSSSEAGAKATCARVEETGQRCITVKADISRFEDVEKLLQVSLSSYHEIDVLVNNAGIFVRKHWDEIDLGTWDRLVQTNLTGTFLCTQTIGRQMVKQGGGRIINIASIGGLQAW